MNGDEGFTCSHVIPILFADLEISPHSPQPPFPRSSTPDSSPAGAAIPELANHPNDLLGAGRHFRWMLVSFETLDSIDLSPWARKILDFLKKL